MAELEQLREAMAGIEFRDTDAFIDEIPWLLPRSDADRAPWLTPPMVDCRPSAHR